MRPCRSNFCDFCSLFYENSKKRNQVAKLPQAVCVISYVSEGQYVPKHAISKATQDFEFGVRAPSDYINPVEYVTVIY